MKYDVYYWEDGKLPSKAIISSEEALVEFLILFYIGRAHV